MKDTETEVGEMVPAGKFVYPLWKVQDREAYQKN